MNVKILSFFVFIPFLALTGCLGEDDSNTDAPTETGRAIPDIDFTCSPALDASCGAASNGDMVFLVWTSESCANFTGDAINVYNSQPAACDGSGCTAANVGSWFDNATDTPASTMPSATDTAAIWFDTFDNGANNDDGPDAGDIFCCLDSQSSAASVTDSNCQVLGAP